MKRNFPSKKVAWFMLLKIRSYWVIVFALITYGCSPDDGGTITDPGLIFLELSGEENFYEDMNEELPVPSFKTWDYVFTAFENFGETTNSGTRIRFTVNNVEDNEQAYFIYLEMFFGNLYLKEGTYEYDNYETLSNIRGGSRDPLTNMILVETHNFRRLSTGDFAAKRFLTQSGVISIDRTERGELYAEFNAKLAYVYNTENIYDDEEFEIVENALQVKGRFVISDEN